MNLLHYLSVLVLLKLCDGSPVFARSLRKDLVSCPTGLDILDEFQQMSPCTFLCSEDSDCRISGTVCCVASCGTVCVAESLIEEDTKDDIIEPESESKEGRVKESDPMINRQLELLSEKLKEKRLSSDSNSSESKSSDDDDDLIIVSSDSSEDSSISEQSSSSSSSSSSLSSSDEVGTSDVGESSYDVTSGVTPTGNPPQSSSAIAESFDSSFDEFSSSSSIDETDAQEHLEYLLLKLLYEIKSQENAEHNLSAHIEPDLVQEDTDEQAVEVPMNSDLGELVDDFNDTGMKKKSKKRTSMEKRDDGAEDVGGKMEKVAHNRAMR